MRRGRKTVVEESGPSFALPDRILLAGFMGTGKSTVGRRLAEIVKRPFVDLDRVIESGEGLPVAEIIARNGEAAFRAIETREAARIARLPGTVVATGGGTLLSEENRDRLLTGDTRVFVLTAAIDEIVRRIAQEHGTRPLIAGGEPSQRVALLMAERREHYASLGEQIDTTGKTVEEVAREVLARIAPEIVAAGVIEGLVSAESDDAPALEDDHAAVADGFDVLDVTGAADARVPFDEPQGVAPLRGRTPDDLG
ncbi:MAG: shikimate kinase [bacterium]